MPRGQQKVRLAKEDLPPVSRLSDGSYGYVVRYRIISEDQNRYSHWSPIREIPVDFLQPVSGAVVANGSVIQVVWGDEEARPNYDVFVKFDDGEYFYHGTTPTHQYSFLGDAALSVQVAIQIASTEKQRAAGITIFESSPVDLVDLS
jgi:hypothetical protein